MKGNNMLGFQHADTPEYKEKTLSRADRRTSRPKLFLIICAMMAFCLLLGGCFLFPDPTIKANVTVCGVSVQGMSQKDAAKAINDAFLLSHQDKQMTVKISDETITLTSDVTKVQLDTEELVKAVAKYASKSDQQEVFPFGEFVQMDEEAVMPILQAVTDKLHSTLVQSTYEVTGTAPEKFDVIDETCAQKLTIHIGTPGISVDPQHIFDMIKNAYAEANYSFEFVFPIETPDPLNIEEIYSTHCTSPVNAYVNEENTKKFELIKESLGFAFDLAAVTEAVAAAMPGEQLEFDFAWVIPEETEETIYKAMFGDVLGDMSTTAGWSATRNKNLRLGCEAINGTILMPGETFSFNKIVGATTKDKGYDTGHGYLEGEVAEVIGGGICQVASTLYVACVEADLRIVERYMHAYMPSYMGASTDATIFYPYLDFKFKNDTDRPIMVEAIASGATVTCKILSVDTRDYYVKFETVIVKDIPWKTVYKEYPPDNPEGYTDGQVLSKSSPYSSVESKSYRNKYSKETNKLISSKLENHETYDSRDKVVVKIVDPNPPTTPVPTPEDTPVPSPDNTPVPSPDNTPVPSPENTPSPSPDNTPSPSPENTPDNTPENTPSNGGEITEDGT